MAELVLRAMDDKIRINKIANETKDFADTPGSGFACWLCKCLVIFALFAGNISGCTMLHTSITVHKVQSARIRPKMTMAQIAPILIVFIMFSAVDFHFERKE